MIRSSARPSLASAASSAASAGPEVREPGEDLRIGRQHVPQHLDRLCVAPRGLEAAAERGARLRRRARERDGLLEAREPVARPHEQGRLEQAERGQPARIGRDAARLGDLEQLRERLGVGRRALARCRRGTGGRAPPTPARVAAGRAHDRVAQRADHAGRVAGVAVGVREAQGGLDAGARVGRQLDEAPQRAQRERVVAARDAELVQPLERGPVLRVERQDRLERVLGERRVRERPLVQIGDEELRRDLGLGVRRGGHGALQGVAGLEPDALRGEQPREQEQRRRVVRERLDHPPDGRDAHAGVDRARAPVVLQHRPGDLRAEQRDRLAARGLAERLAQPVGEPLGLARELPGERARRGHASSDPRGALSYSSSARAALGGRVLGGELRRAHEVHRARGRSEDEVGERQPGRDHARAVAEALREPIEPARRDDALGPQPEGVAEAGERGAGGGGVRVGLRLREERLLDAVEARAMGSGVSSRLSRMAPAKRACARGAIGSAGLAFAAMRRIARWAAASSGASFTMRASASSAALGPSCSSSDAISRGRRRARWRR